MFLATATGETVLSFLQAIAPLLAGPGAAAIALFLIIAFCLYIVYKKVIPFISKLLEDHREDLRTIMNEHAQDRIAFTEGMKNLADGMIKIEYRMSSIEKAMQGVSDELDDLKDTKRK